MIISEKQIMELMRLVCRYASVCTRMGLKDDQEECRDLYREIEKQQSEELKGIE